MESASPVAVTYPFQCQAVVLVSIGNRSSNSFEIYLSVSEDILKSIVATCTLISMS